MTSSNQNLESEGDALLGELARPLAHEFNNFLNTLLLQLAVMEQTGHGLSNAELSALRREAKSIAQLIRQWQRYKNEPGLVRDVVDLNQIIRDIVSGLSGGSTSIELSLSSGATMVLGSAIDLKRLCSIVIRNALAAVNRAAMGTIKIRSEAKAGEVTLIVQDNREGMATQDTSTWFDIRRENQSGNDTLEMAACQALARRLSGQIRAEKASPNELVIQVVLPSAM